MANVIIFNQGEIEKKWSNVKFNNHETVLKAFTISLPIVSLLNCYFAVFLTFYFTVNYIAFVSLHDTKNNS